MTGWKNNHEWRCISKVKMVIFHCHASFRGSNSSLSVWSTFIKSPTVTKCSNLQYHSPPSKFRNLRIGHSPPNPRKFTPIPKKICLKKKIGSLWIFRFFSGMYPPTKIKMEPQKLVRLVDVPLLIMWYCWWFRNLANHLRERLFIPLFAEVSYISDPGWWSPDFWTINSHRNLLPHK